MKKYNQLLIKDNNKKQVYQMIEDMPGTSRTQIAEQMKLSKTTVSALVDELMQEVFLLEMDMKNLCSEDCKGLCSGCGADLNREPCRCKKEIDPRLAKLAQLLEDGGLKE